LNACDHAQGFLYSPAIRVNDFALFINAHEMKRHQQALSEQHAG
jgi:hypothetical protein